MYLLYVQLLIFRNIEDEKAMMSWLRMQF